MIKAVGKSGTILNTYSVNGLFRFEITRVFVKFKQKSNDKTVLSWIYEEYSTLSWLLIKLIR